MVRFYISKCIRLSKAVEIFAGTKHLASLSQVRYLLLFFLFFLSNDQVQEGLNNRVKVATLLGGFLYSAAATATS